MSRNEPRQPLSDFAGKDGVATILELLTAQFTHEVYQF